MPEQPQFGSRPPAAPLHQRAELQRAHLGWTKTELCQRAGIARTSYDRLAIQPTPPNFRTVNKICTATGIDVTEGLRLAGIETAAPEQQPQLGTPEWARTLENAAAEVGKSLAQVGSVLSAQAAMGWAYRGDLDNTRQALAGMPPEQLRELSAAASLLAALADEELSTR